MGITQNNWTKPHDIFSKTIFLKFPRLKTQQPPPPAKMVGKQPTFQLVREVAKDMQLTSVVMWRRNYGNQNPNGHVSNPTKTVCIYKDIDIHIYIHMYINISVLVTILNILIILVMGGYQRDQ